LAAWRFYSGLVFLLPTERKLSSQMDAFENSQQQIEYYLSQVRKQRDEQTGAQQ
jgi:hypothetical protein